MLRPIFVLAIMLLPAAFATADDVVVEKPLLRFELLTRVKNDQEARKALVGWLREHGQAGNVDPAALGIEQNAEYEKLEEAVRMADRENTTRLVAVVKQHGWPTITRVGVDGAHAAWLLVQHADVDVKFQRQCLDQMAALPASEVSQSNLAYLTDRVLLAEGKKQRYGTQFTFADGKWSPRPLEDEAQVDQLRASVGLPSLAEYTKQMEAVYGSPAKK